PHATTTPSTTSASTTILASEVTTAGSVNVTITTNVSTGCPFGGGLTSAPATFTINPPLTLLPGPPPSPVPLGNGTAGSPYFACINANGGTAPYSAPNVTGANVPPFTAGPSCTVQIFFTPSAPTTYNFSVTVTDSGGGQITTPYTFTITQSTLSVFAGSPQSANVNTTFSSPLVVRVTSSSGFGIFGVPVTFTPPPSSGP